MTADLRRSAEACMAKSNVVHLQDLITDFDRAAKEDVAREGDSHAARVELL